MGNAAANAHAGTGDKGRAALKLKIHGFQAPA
jgi:hypothetical protein